jgi:hypothetical protein
MTVRYALVCFAIAAAPLAAQSYEHLDGDKLTDEQIQQIIERFAAKEAEFAAARENYTYRQTARVQELDPGGRERGRFELVTDIVFDNGGKRSERVVFAPVSTLQNIQLTPQDEEDLRSVQPFVLTSQDVDQYYVRYLGKETLDEIPCFAFAVKPKQMKEGQRYFAGIVWVDDRDLQIVKTYGRGVGLLKKNSDNKFPKFETYREQIDGQYWFPTYTIANDTLMFENGPQRIRMVVRYEEYKKFTGQSTITFDDPAETDKNGKPADKK